MLGRPLGAPDEPDFQRKVLKAALGLFELPRGPEPILEDFPEPAPFNDSSEISEGMTCPISFNESLVEETLNKKVLDEISQLRVWYDLALTRRGRTTLGVAGESVEKLVQFLYAWMQDQTTPSYRSDQPIGNALRLACEEIKALYLESDAGQPGKRSPQIALQWFWHQTKAGDLFKQIQNLASKSPDKDVNHFSQQNLMPRAAIEPNQPLHTRDA
jgi:hypothetical protein